MSVPSYSGLVTSLVLTVIVAAPTIGAGPDWIADQRDTASLDLPDTESSIPSPAVHLGYPLGHRFTRHHEILDYLRRLDSLSDRVTLWEYGRSYEDRPLTLIAISSAANIARLEDLRRDHLMTANEGHPSQIDLDAGESSPPVFVWLAYGIHGNEASSAETAMATAFVLASASGSWAETLENLVVLIDPTVNPDGRERFVHSYRSTRGARPDPSPDAAEHHEPWPGGRQNHYLVDLNRDWTWVTQRETAARLEEYRRWEPHVYVDFHEMSSSSTYFFPPSTEPIHPGIDPRTVGWLEVFGSENARAFDRLGWSYYVGENFDLFYPGYSDSYPSLRGAIGMTYEVAGHGRAGLAIQRPDGSLLTLSDRIVRHLTATLATLETSARHRKDILHDFVAARRRAAAREGRTFVWRAEQAEAEATASLLELHGLSVLRLPEDRTLDVRPVDGTESRREQFAAGTYLVHTAQTLGALAETLMEPDTPMPDEFLAEQRRRVEDNLSPEFFDITVWSVPLAFDLETFVADGSVAGTPRTDEETGRLTGDGDLGYLVRPRGIVGYQLASSLLDQGVRFRLTLSPFEQSGRAFPRGTLFIPGYENPDDLEERLVELARSLDVEIERVASGLTQSGISLGSDDVVRIRRPEIGLVGGPGVHATSFGFIWFLLDQTLQIPYSSISIDEIDEIDLGNLDVLVFPDGQGYPSRLSEDSAARIGRWLDDGGTLVAVGAAIEWLQQHDLTTIEAWREDSEESGDDDEPPATPLPRSLYTPGAALGTLARESHALTVGTGSAPHVLFRGRTALRPTGDPRKDVIVVDPEQPLAAGFAWPEAEERLRGALILGAERKGDGAVIVFAQDPFFRLFWRASAPPFLNSLLFAPSLGDNGRLFE